MTNRYTVLLVLILAVVIRLVAIDAPLLGAASARQCDCAQVARNYHLRGYRIARPEVDRAGVLPAPVMTGFPAYQFAVACLYAVIGVHESAGRLISLVFSLIALWYLFRFVRLRADEDTARWSVFFCAILPLNAYYGRAFAPDSAVIASAIAGIYYFDRWLDRRCFHDWLFSVLLVMAACLMNAGFVFLALPLSYMAVPRHHRSAARYAALVLYAVAVLAPTALWAAHVRVLYQESGLALAGDETYVFRPGEIPALICGWDFWNQAVFQRLAGRHLTWFGFAAMIWGFVLKRRTEQEKVFDYWLAGALLYAVVFARGGISASHHSLIFVAPAAVFMGKVYARYYHLRLWRSGASAALVAGLAGLILTATWRYSSLLLAEDTADSGAWKVASLLREKTEAGAAVVAVDEGNPADLYYSERRGWCVKAAEVSEGGIKLLDDLSARGARYAAGMQESFVPEKLAPAFKRIMKRYPAVYDDGRFFILNLRK